MARTIQLGPAKRAVIARRRATGHRHNGREHVALALEAYAAAADREAAARADSERLWGVYLRVLSFPAPSPGAATTSNEEG